MWNQHVYIRILIKTLSLIFIVSMHTLLINIAYFFVENDVAQMYQTIKICQIITTPTEGENYSCL